jgi:hypothetical protein
VGHQPAEKSRRLAGGPVSVGLNGGSSTASPRPKPRCPLSRPMAGCASSVHQQARAEPARPLPPQTFLYRGNLGASGGSGGIAATLPVSYTINNGVQSKAVGSPNGLQLSDWDCAAVLWYNRVLPAAEYRAVEEWLNEVYCIVKFPPPPPAPPACESAPARSSFSGRAALRGHQAWASRCAERGPPSSPARCATRALLHSGRASCRRRKHSPLLPPPPLHPGRRRARGQQHLLL